MLRDPRVRGGHADRQRGGRPVGRRDRRPRAQEDRAGAGRQRPVRRDAVGRPRPGRRGGDHRALPEQRPVLHRGQAVHRAHRRLRRVRRRVRRRRWRRSRVGDPMDDGTDVGPLATEQGRDDVEELVDDAVAKGARVLCGGERAGPARAGATRRPWSPTSPPDMRMYHRGGVRAGRRAVPGAGTSTRRSSWPTPPTFGLGLQRLDHRPGRAGALHRRPRGRAGVHQRHDHVVPRAAVRRRQELRATGGSCPRTASASSATSRPSGSVPVTPPPPAPVPTRSRDGPHRTSVDLAPAPLRSGR